MRELHAIPVRAASKTYGYAVKIVKGKIPPHITANPFYWYKYKRDAQLTCDRINRDQVI